MNPIEQQMSAQAALISARETITYTIPESLRDSETKRPSNVTMRALTADEELTASRLGRFDVMKSQYAATKLSIVALDGAPVSTADGSTDAFWERSDPRLRSLILQAYNKLSSPTQAEEDAFFKSATARV